MWLLNARFPTGAEGPGADATSLYAYVSVCEGAACRMDGCAMDGLADGRSRKTTFDFPPRGVTRTIDRRLNGISGNMCVCVCVVTFLYQFLSQWRKNTPVSLKAELFRPRQ